MELKVGKRVVHYKTKRPGKVVYFGEDAKMMLIEFDDGTTEYRYSRLFIAEPAVTIGGFGTIKAAWGDAEAMPVLLSSMRVLLSAMPTAKPRDWLAQGTLG